MVKTITTDQLYTGLETYLREQTNAGLANVAGDLWPEVTFSLAGEVVNCSFDDEDDAPWFVNENDGYIKD